MTTGSGVWLVVAGALVGAPLRYLVSLAAARRPGFPWGTLVVNLVGSAALGALVGLGHEGDGAGLLLGTGFCGALTTWSTFGAETVALWEEGRRSAAVSYVAASVVVGVGLAAVALVVARSSA